MKTYLGPWVEDNKIINNIRQAIQEACPEYEETLNKLLILK